MNLADHPILIILAAAVAAPLLAEMPIARRTPIVALEVLLGIVIGPHALGLIQFDAFLSAMLRIGTAAVLFMAGMEIDFERVRGRPLWLALGGWIASVGLALLAVALLHVIPDVHAPMMVTLALTTTGLGTLLPVLREGGQLETPFGRLLLATGAVGEVGPIVGVSLVLSDRYTTWQEFSFLIFMLALVVLAAAVGMGARQPRLLTLLSRTLSTSTQLPVRLALLVLAAFVSVAIGFGFEGILGAFAAGMVVGLATRGEAGKAFRVRIEAVCFGWFTPFFFVGAGVAYDLGALTRDVTTMLLIPTFLVLFLMVRGAPVLLYRNDIPKLERLPFGLFVSIASLGLVVVIAQVGLTAQKMNQDVAQALVGAALLTSLVYPTLAQVLLSKSARSAPRAD